MLVAVLAVVVVASLWLVIAAGVQRESIGGSSAPTRLPNAPAVVEIQQSSSAGQDRPVPVPGVAPLPADDPRAPR